MALSPGTLTLTSMGTTTLALSTLCTLSASNHGSVVAFPVGSTAAALVTALQSTYGTTYSFNQTLEAFLLDSVTPSVQATYTVSPDYSQGSSNNYGAGDTEGQPSALMQFSGVGGTLGVAVYEPGKSYASSGTNIAASSASGGTTLTYPATESYSAPSAKVFQLQTMQVVYTSVPRLAWVVDANGYVADTAGTYTAQSFFPLMNAAGVTGGPFSGVAFTDVNTHKTAAVVSGSFYAPGGNTTPLVEITSAGGSSVGYYQLYFPGGEFTPYGWVVQGTTAGGFYCRGSASNSLVEINPIAGTVTTYVFSAQDSTSGSILSYINSQNLDNFAAQSTPGTWYLTDTGTGFEHIESRSTYHAAISGAASSESITLSSFTGTLGQVGTLTGITNGTAPTSQDATITLNGSSYATWTALGSYTTSGGTSAAPFSGYTGTLSSFGTYVAQTRDHNNTSVMSNTATLVVADCCQPLPVKSLGRWRGGVGINFYGQTLIGDAYSGVLGTLDFGTFQEYGNTMYALVTSPPVHNDRRRIFIPRFEIDVESGVGNVDCCGTNPLWMLDVSKDGGRTFGPQQVFRSMGQLGQYTQRLRWLRLGQARQWIFRLQSTDPVRRVIIGTYYDLYQEMGATGP